MSESSYDLLIYHRRAQLAQIQLPEVANPSRLGSLSIHAALELVGNAWLNGQFFLSLVE